MLQADDAADRDRIWAACTALAKDLVLSEDEVSEIHVRQHGRGFLRFERIARCLCSYAVQHNLPLLQQERLGSLRADSSVLSDALAVQK